jgi:NDP-sugar pyrophosphorylase family protein
MLPVGGKPFLDILIDYMYGFGFRRFILGTGYKAGIIKRHYASIFKKDISISFSREERPLGTGGAVKKARKLIKSNIFFVLNGDSFCGFDPVNFLKFHKNKKSSLSILLRKITDGKDYGEVVFDKSFRILKFNEKNEKAKQCWINAGIYLFNKEILDFMPPKSIFSLEIDFFPEIVKNKVYGYTKSGCFLDIGTPQRYLTAEKYLNKYRVS